jgi:hypothetical protein
VTALDMRAEVAKLVGRINLDERMRIRAVQESVNNARACTWRRTADRLEWARPVSTDWPGNATAEELAERDRRLAGQAAAARHKAELLELGLLDFDEGASS